MVRRAGSSREAPAEACVARPCAVRVISPAPIVGVLGACSLLACAPLARPELYPGPRRSPTEVAHVTHDGYARILKIDDRDVSGYKFQEFKQLELLPGCHTVSVAYSVTMQKTTFFDAPTLPSLAVGALTARAAQSGNTKKTTTKYGDSSSKTTYETVDPVVFAIEMRPSIVYWFKATFDGTEFSPEVVEQDEANRSFTPGAHCRTLASAPVTAR